MRKTLKLARREYLAAVRTKGFVIALVVAPLMMSGSGVAFALLKDRVDTRERRIALVDPAGLVAPAVLEAAARRDETETRHPQSGRQIRPAYRFEVPEGAAPLDDAARLELSNRVRRGDLSAFVEVGPEALHPGADAARSRIAYYAPNAVLDDARQWLGGVINNQLRQARLRDLGLAADVADELFRWSPVEPMGLVSVDRATGRVQEARRSRESEAILVPLILPLLMYLMLMMGAVPQLGSVAEEKTQRIADVLLGSVRPFQFMMGKVLGGVGVSLTGVAVYVVLGLALAHRLGAEEYVPYAALPWFLGFLALAILMYGAIFTAVGAACNDTKEAQSATFPAMVPIILPMFVLMPLLQHPNSSFATWLSLIPVFTPLAMVLRLASPVGIPSWQPWLGLGLVLATTALAVWAGGRVFRVAILMQGTPPRLATLARWALRG